MAARKAMLALAYPLMLISYHPSYVATPPFQRNDYPGDEIKYKANDRIIGTDNLRNVN